MIYVSIEHESLRLRMEQTCREMLDQKDLPGGWNKISRSLIRLLFGRPASFYFYMEMNAEITIQKSDGQSMNLSGTAQYELLSLNDHPTRFEDLLRKNLHRFVR